jgi:MATE family multidrug resistance protein
MNALLLCIFTDRWISFFTEDVVVAQLIREIVPWVAVYIVVDGLKATVAGLFRGCGLQRIGAWINLAGYYVIAIPVGVLLGFTLKMGLTGIWVGNIAGLSLVAFSEAGVILSLDWNDHARKAQRRANESNQMEQ